MIRLRPQQPRKIWLPALLILAGLPIQLGAAIDPPQAFIPWRAPDGKVLPFTSDDEVLDFLRTARVVSSKRLSTGINRPFKVLLERDFLQVHAIFRDVREEQSKAEVRGTLRFQFRDDAIFEVAAYELSRLLGLRTIPPTVARTIDGKPGSLQMWVEGAMTENDRRKSAQTPPLPLEWARASQVRYAFDELIHNDDRNLGNILIDPEWKVWLVDHTRAFHPYAKIYETDRLRQISQTFWQALNRVSPDQVRERLRDYLNRDQLEALLRRWQLLVDYYSKRIQQWGPEAVLFTM